MLIVKLSLIAAATILMYLLGFSVDFGIIMVEIGMALVIIDQQSSIRRLRVRLRTVERHLVLDDND